MKPHTPSRTTLKPFRPRIIQSLKGYNLRRFVKDLAAGATVGVVALPLAMAFAIASGLQPQVGLFTAVIAGLIISVLGGSSVQIGGPAGAFIVVVLGIVQTHGVANLLISTIMAGLLLILMGWTGLGSLVRLIPVSIVIGFTNGIAVLIALSQLKDFFGLQFTPPNADFFTKHWTLLTQLPHHNIAALMLSCACLAFLFIWAKLQKQHDKMPSRLKNFLHIPGSVIVLVTGTLVAWVFNINIETIGSKFGDIPRALPNLAWPSIEFQQVPKLIAPTLTITFLCAIESLLCARVADGLIHEKHDPNQELMAQGIANIVAPLFGGMPATGTIARTVTNIRSGANSPIAGVVHALTLLSIMLIAAPLASHIPLAVLSAILMFVAYNMGEWKEFARLKQYSLMYRTILLATFTLTIIIDLTVAVEVGLVLAVLFFIYRVSTLTEFTPIGLKEEDAEKGIQAYSIYGSLFFAVVGKIENLLLLHPNAPKVLILDMHQTISIDTTALEALEELHKDLHAQGSLLIFCGLNRQAQSLLHRSGFEAKLSPAQQQPDLAHAMTQALAHCETQ